MEAALSSSAFVSKLSPIPNYTNRINFVKMGPKTLSYLGCSNGSHRVLLVAAASKDVPDESDDQQEKDLLFLNNNNTNNNGFQLLTQDTLSLSHEGNSHSDEKNENGAIGTPKTEAHFPGKNSDDDENGEKKIQNMEKPMVVTYSSVTGGGGTRAGLFRTPISGGVQSATSAHGLPPPSLAVRNLMEQARFAHLCTVMSQMHHRREGYPFGSLVDFATDSMGHPIFSFSPLAIHTRNLLKDPRCSLVVQIPGWSGLSNARVTIVGDVFPLSDNQQEWAHKQYIAKHQQGPSQQWGNFYYFRMQNITYASKSKSRLVFRSITLILWLSIFLVFLV